MDQAESKEQRTLMNLDAATLYPARPNLRIKTPKYDLEACEEKCTSPDTLKQNLVPSKDKCLQNLSVRREATGTSVVILFLGLYLLGHGILNDNSFHAWFGTFIGLVGLFFLTMAAS